jgi:hypothetical protein
MKTLNLLSLFLFSLLLLTSCGDKKDPAPDPATAIAGTMTAKIDGVAWSATTVNVGDASPNGISINGYNNDKRISITIGNVVKPGRFDAFVFESLQGWYTVTGNSTMQVWSSFPSNKCRLDITRLDWVGKRMSGTFSFLADSLSSGSSGSSGVSLQITDGVFTDLPITVAPPASSVEMSANVNNLAWNASGMYMFGFTGFYQLIGSDAAGQAITINGISSLQPGTYTALWSEFTIPANSDFQTWITDTNTPASVTITSFDPVAKKVSGTYSFTADATGLAGATGTKTISQGSFTDVPVF